MIVISHVLWARRFGSNPAVVGRRVTLGDRPVQVVGVMPESFRFPDAAIGMWKPIVLDAEALSDNNRGSHGYMVLARLRPGRSLAGAQEEVNALGAAFQTEHPGNYRNGFGATLRPLHDEIVGDSRRPLLVLLGAVALVLLIACANVATLQLARAAAWRKEMAVRTALGARRQRLVRQLLTESVLVALAGGASGLLLARWSIDALVASAPTTLPRVGEVALDSRVVVFAAAVSVGTGLLFGIVPALRTTRTGLHEALREGGRAAFSPVHADAGRLLVVAEVALSLVLLVGAGLLVHSFARLQEVHPGFEPRNLLTFRLSLPESRYSTFQQGDAFFDELFRSLAASPGVASVAAINSLPFSGSGGSRTFYIEGREIRRPEDQLEKQLRIVTQGYFETMRIPVARGREFSPRDTLASPRVAVVNDAFARKHFPDGGAIGARITFSRSEPHWYEIVGIVGNVKHRGLDARDRPEVYVPYRQPLFDSWAVRPMFIVARTAVDPLSMLAAVRRRIALTLLGAFAAFALTLAAIGIYAIVAYAVHQRTHEIGVRLALGAQRRDVMRLIVGQGLALTAAGVAAGAAAAIALARVISSLLFGVSPFDPMTFALVVPLFLAVGFAACYLPARRAMRVSPLEVLRLE